jgi:hypothetical protein
MLRLTSRPALLAACALVAAALTSFAAPLSAQNPLPLPAPWASPRAQVSQVIGISTVTIDFDYGRPAVKERAVWGGLVPWGEVWRAGANENTTIELTHDALVEGKPLPAGWYGLHMLPREDGVTVIFSSNAQSWGSYRYTSDEDVLRVEVKFADAPHQEWLAFEFDALTANDAVCKLRWGTKAVPFRIAFDTPNIVLANARDSYLRDLTGFFPQAWANAAAYCLTQGINLEEGLQWAERSLAMDPSFKGYGLKAALLEKLGRASEATAAREAAAPLMAQASETELNQHGYELLQSGQLDAAIKAFEFNTQQHPSSWNVWDSLGEAYATKGDKAKARELYAKALSMVGSDTENKTRIQKVLKELGGA